MDKPPIVNYINKLLEIGYIFLIAITPIIMLSITSELFEFNKTIFIYAITILILFLWLVKIKILKTTGLKKNFFFLPFIVFLSTQTLSTIFSIDLWTSLFGYYGRFNGGLISIFTYLSLFFIFIANYNDFSHYFLERFLRISLFSSLLVILWGLPGKFGYDLTCYLFTKKLDNTCWTDQFRPNERIFSTLGQPNWLGAYLLINFFIGLYFYFKNEDNLKYIFLNGLYLFLNFSALLFTRSRSSLLAFFIGIILFIIFYVLIRLKNTFRHFSNYQSIIFLFLILFIPTLIFKTGVPIVDQILSKPINFIKPKTSESSSKIVKPSSILVTDSGEIRKIVWKGAIDLGLKYPFLGTGVETFAYSYYFVRPKEHNLTSEWDYLYNKAHNEYLNYLATTGFIGLISYLLMIISVFYLFILKIKDQREERDIFNSGQALLKICLLLAYLSILITNFFGFSTTTINLFFYLIPAVLFVLVFPKLSTNHDKKIFFSKQTISLPKSFLFLLAFIFLYLEMLVFSYWLADVFYNKGNLYNQTGQYQIAVDYYNQALKLRYEHVYEDKLSFALANLAFVASYQKENALSERLIKLSDFYNQKSLHASPKNVLYWKTQAKNYYLFYQISNRINWLKNGVIALKQAQKLALTDPKISYNLALFASLLSDEEKNNPKWVNLALSTIDHSISLKPNFRDAYFLKGQLLKKYGRKDEAKKIFQYILERINPDDEEIKKEIIQ